ncbi:MAG: peptidoglycan editing factor PgeF [Bacteroidota bacterium]
MAALRYDEPPWLAAFRDQLIAVQSTRLGGVSRAPYASLNLGLHTQDDPVRVAENRRLFCADVGFEEKQVAGGYQIHGDQILPVDTPGQTEGFDAFVTNRKDLMLSVTIADCVPVLLYDPVQRAVGAAHAGWRGTASEITRKTLAKMSECYGTQARDCWAYIGTCIGSNDFEVDTDVADHFTTTYQHFDPKRGKYLVDLQAHNRDQLLAQGVPSRQIACSPHSTVAQNQRYFSHRKEKGKTGRMLAVIGLK